MNPDYKPYLDRAPDVTFRNALLKIDREGKPVGHPFQPMGRRAILNLPTMEFLISNGFPMITERSMKGFWRKPIGELLGFIHGVRDAKVLAEKWGANWWLEQWATPEKCADFGLAPGDLGPGSYGGAFEYITPEGGTWNQFREVIKQIKDRPEVITHKITTWLPHYCIGTKENPRKVVVAPCHGDIEITIEDGEFLTYRMDQRSGDFLIGVPANMIQHTAVAMGLAHVLGYKLRKYIHCVHNAQLYDDHKPFVDEVTSVARFPRLFPTVLLTEEGLKVTDFFDFRPHHFELSDYKPYPAIPGIPVTT